MNNSQSSLKVGVLMTIVTALVVGLILLMFASSDDDLDNGISVGEASGRIRVIGERNAERGGADLAKLVASQACQDASNADRLCDAFLVPHVEDKEDPRDEKTLDVTTQIASHI